MELRDIRWCRYVAKTFGESQEHRRCCGAPRSLNGRHAMSQEHVARASEVLWSSENAKRPQSRRAFRVARASEVLWSSENHLGR